MQLKGIDKYFREKLLGYKPRYDDSLWAGIENELDQEKSKFWSRRNMVPVAMLMSFTVLLSYTGSLQHNVESKTLSLRNNSALHLNQGNIFSLPGGYGTQVNANGDSKGINDNNIASVSGNNNGWADRGTSHLGNKIRRTGLKSSGRLATISQNANNLAANGIIKGTEHLLIADNQKESIVNPLELVKKAVYLDLVKGDVSGQGTVIEAGSYRSRDHKQIEKEKLASQQAGWSSIFGGFAANPAYVGAEAKYNFNSAWNGTLLEKSGQGNIQSTYAYDMNLNRFGVGVYNNRNTSAQSLNNTMGFALSAVAMRIGQGQLRVGGAATVLYKEVYFSDLHFADEADPVFGFIHSTKEKSISSRNYTNGYDAGLYYEHSRLNAGFSVMNINQPSFGLLENAARLDRMYKSTLSYRMSLGKGVDITPLLVLSRTGGHNTASAFIMASYGNKVMLGVGYENFDSKDYLGNVSANAAIQIRKKARVFGSFGRNMQYELLGVHQNILRAGIRFQIH